MGGYRGEQLLAAAAGAETHPGEWLMTWLVVGSVVLVALFVEGFPPAVLLVAALSVGGLISLARGSRLTGAVMLLTADLVFLWIAAPYLLSAVMEPLSPIEYAAAAGFLLAAICVFLAAGLVWREETSGQSITAMTSPALATGGVVVLALAITFAGVSRLLTDDVAPIRSEYVLEADQPWFSVADITLGSGDVALVVDNKDLMVHSFVIDKLDVNTTIPGGLSRRITFAASPGKYTYYCEIPGNEMMRGKLTIMEGF